MTLPDAAKAVVKRWLDKYGKVRCTKEREQVAFVQEFMTHLPQGVAYKKVR